jgi:flagellar biosynthetic protein FliS
VSSTSPANKYLEASIATLSKEDLMVKVFDAIVLFTRKAIDKMQTEPNDIQGRHDLLRTAQRACAAAIDAIDFEIGGELAESNAALYRFWYRELVQANMTGDVARAAGVLPQMVMIRDAWAEAVRRYKIEFASSAPRVDVAVV